MGISKLAWLGVATETTAGTAASTPTLYVPAKSDMKFMRPNSKLDEDRGTRDETYGVIYGVRHAETSIKNSFYFDTDPYFLKSAIGTDTVTQPDATNAPTVYKHTFGFSNTPSALTLFQFDDPILYYSSYSAVEKFSIKIEGEGKAVEFDASCKGLYPVKFATTIPTPSYSSNKPSAGYNPTIKLSGSGSASTDILDLQLSYEQKLTLFTPIAGSPDFVKIYYGARKASLDFTARFDADTYFTKWTGVTNGTTDSLILDITGDLITTFSGTSYFNELNVNISQFVFDDIQIDKGKDNVLIKVKATIIPNSSLFTMFVQNTVASYAS